jgi:hypothetical protein
MQIMMMMMMTMLHEKCAIGRTSGGAGEEVTW